MFRKKKIEEDSLLQLLPNISDPTTFQFKEIRSADKSMPKFQLFMKNSNGEHVVTHLSKPIEYSLLELSKIMGFIDGEAPKNNVNFIIQARSTVHYKLYEEKLAEFLKASKQKEENTIIIKDINVDKIKELSTEQISSLFVDFCWYGNLSCLKSLVENSFLGSSAEQDQKKAFSIVDVGFHRACSGGNLSVVKYLSENKAISDLITQGGINDGLIFSLNKGHKEVAKYLMTKYDVTPAEWEKTEIEKMGLTGLLPQNKSTGLRLK